MESARVRLDGMSPKWLPPGSSPQPRLTPGGTQELARSHTSHLRGVGAALILSTWPTHLGRYAYPLEHVQNG